MTGNPPADQCPPDARGTFQMAPPDLSGRPIDKIVPHRRASIAAHRCTALVMTGSCPHLLKDFRDALSATEAGMSGLCQCCQDDVFSGSDDDDDEPDLTILATDQRPKLGPEPCGQFRKALASDPQPSVEHPKITCRCGWSWQLHRYDADGPTQDQRAEIIRDPQTNLIDALLGAAVELDQPADTLSDLKDRYAPHPKSPGFVLLKNDARYGQPARGSFLDLIQRHLTDAAGRPIYLTDVTDLIKDAEDDD